MFTKKPSRVNERNKKTEFTIKDVSNLPAPFRMEKKMGEKLGDGHLLQ
jgi:hypothetical protein